MKSAIALAFALTAACLIGGCSQSSKTASLAPQAQDSGLATASPSAGGGDMLGMGQYAHRAGMGERVVSAVQYPQ